MDDEEIPPEFLERHMQYGHINAIEDDFEKCCRYVALHPNNYKTFSIEFTRLLLDIGSLVDVFAKLACELIAPGKRVKSIDDYRPILMANQPAIAKLFIAVVRPSIQFPPPFAVWADVPPRNPEWWQAYNGVKHERGAFYQSANLENVATAFGGCLILAGLARIYRPSRNFQIVNPLPSIGNGQVSSGAGVVSS